MHRINFNSLRLALAGCVIFAHSPELIDGTRVREPFTAIGLPFTLGEFAVRGFFILSGFLIAGSWLANPDIFSFLKKRVLRIYPAFIVCSLFCLFMGSVVGGSVNWARSLGAIAILQQPYAAGAFAGSHIPALNGSMWTIIFEFACYVMTAALGMLGVLRGLRSSVMLLLASVALYFVPIPAHGIGYYVGQLLSLAPWFLFGVIFNFRKEWLNWIRLPDLKLDISYGLYLYGWPVQKVMLWVFPNLNQWALSACSVVIACAAAYVSFKFVEEPCLALKKRSNHAKIRSPFPLAH